jgi:hypothetical protein
MLPFRRLHRLVTKEKLNLLKFAPRGANAVHSRRTVTHNAITAATYIRREKTTARMPLHANWLNDFYVSEIGIGYIPPVTAAANGKPILCSSDV